MSNNEAIRASGTVPIYWNLYPVAVAERQIRLQVFSFHCSERMIVYGILRGNISRGTDQGYFRFVEVF